MTTSVAIVPLGLRSYSAGVSALVLASAATDVFTITGFNGGIVKVTKITIGGVATAALTGGINLIKRTTANTAGTATSILGVLRDNIVSEPSKALVQSYTANPTVGTATAPTGGNLGIMVLPIGTSAAPVSPLQIGLGDSGLLYPTLRSANDVLAINMAGATIVGGLLTVNIEWTEE